MGKSNHKVKEYETTNAFMDEGQERDGMKEKLIIIGTSTTARHVYDFVKGYNLYEIIGFVVDEKYKDADTFCDLPVFSIEELDTVINKEEVKLFVAVLWNRVNADRRRLYERLKKEGYHFANLISPSAVIRGNLLGDNCWIHDYVIIQSEASVGDNCLLMAFTLVGDFSVIGSHCFTGTKSTIAGKCEIGEQTFVGINCTVFDNTKVGKKCILGACTAVKRNVEDYSIVKTGKDNAVVVQMDEETVEGKLMFTKNVR